MVAAGVVAEVGLVAREVDVLEQGVVLGVMVGLVAGLA